MPTRAREIEFNEAQLRAVYAAKRGENVFLTGPPGTGKTRVLREIVRVLEMMHGAKGLMKMAPTGAAARLLGGQTLNAYPGPGVPDGTTACFHKMRKRREWHRVKVLVVDEISMVDGEFLDWYMANVPPGESPSSSSAGHTLRRVLTILAMKS